ncbi:hypothetical protein ACS0TY_019140 [Phlomoides rotata]
MSKLSNTLTTIKNVLEDAEDKQFQSKSIQNWLSYKLHGIAFENEDILDECATEVSKMKRKVGKFNMKKYLFKNKITTRIKEAVEKLDAFSEDHHRFHLQEIVVRQPTQVDWRLETRSLLNEHDHVYGRNEEKGRTVDILVKEVKDCDCLSILSIIGVGGLGLKAIIFSVTRDKSNLDYLQKRVRLELNVKRYLLILDDVWNDNQEDWVKLKGILACGSIGASVIVTTRLKKVADIMETVPAHCMMMLSLEQCWLLFKLRAFGQENDQHLNLETIERERKRNGFMSRKAMCGIFWKKELDLACLEIELSLSPFCIETLFCYCAIFPKNFMFEKEKLIFHWMAHRCILSNGEEDVEDVGDRIRNELVKGVSLSHTPYRIRELTSLKTLSMFIVGDNRGHQLDELEHLSLGGILEIRHLERAQNHTNANLVEKPNLHALVFHWEYPYDRST